MLKHDLNKDLDLHRNDIEKILAREIIKSYYYQRGQMVYALGQDKVTDRACEMFNKPGEYERILNITPAKKNAGSARDKTKKNKSRKK